ncbi:MAG: hypothetical protein DELT_01692 [Desulfovibrio sp.]
MKIALLGFTVLASLLWPTSGYALDISHSGNGWVQGMCSYEFTLDGQREQFDSMEGISILILGVHGYEADDPDNPFTQELEVEAFADSNATRFSKTYWEGECGISQFVIYKALAIIDGKPRDLLREGGLHVAESPLKEAVTIKLRD